MKYDDKQAGFTAIELLITLFIAAAFLLSGLQLYASIIKNSSETRAQTNASNVVYDYLQRYKSAVTNPCTAQTPLTNQSITIAGLSDVTITVGISCPYSATTSVSKISATILYNSPQQTVNNAIYTTDLASSYAELIPITAIGAISGTAEIGSTLTAGALTPSNATVTYQWQSATTVDGTYTNISGSTSNTYTLITDDAGKYLKVVATGTDIYVGTQTSAASSQIIGLNPADWLTIGTQTWAKYNLDVGTRIAGNTNQTNNGGTNIVEKYCYGNTDAGCTNTDSNGIPYGGLYQWDEAMKYVTTEGAQGICPNGSHIPTDAELTTLGTYLGAGTAGTQLKSGGSSGLNIPFTGVRATDGSFFGLLSFTDIWSSSESGASAWNREVNTAYAYLGRGELDETYGFSVRCIGNL